MAKKQTVNKLARSAHQNLAEGAAGSQFRQRYEAQQELTAAQPQMVQRFLEAQGRQIAEAILEDQPQVKFSLPDRVMVEAGETKARPVPKEFREQMAGGLMDRLTRADLRDVIRQRLVEMEQHSDPAIAVGAGLLRFATVMHMVHNMLPSGRTVRYTAADGEEIPTLPVEDEMEPESAITAATDAIAEEGAQEAGRGELLVPYVAYARRFYLPQWVAFDDKGSLLANSISQARAHVASMQRFLWVLHSAVALAAYMVADPEYQQKRSGMLSQLVNQGRALARFETNEIIKTIKRRAQADDLNRGLSLSLPYFDDQELEIHNHDFEVIPGGRIMFVPAFLVMAAREEQARVAQDTRLSNSTRKHLLEELSRLEKAFEGWKR
jgi:hypothetical protein